MAKFRIKMATIEGELKAKEKGYNSFPVCPKEIAQSEGIMVKGKPPDAEGVSGGIIFNGDDIGIFYATNIDNEGFQKFTIAHELGHFYLPGHPEEIMKMGGFHPSRAGFTEGGSSIELEADHFAAGLLLPSFLVKKNLENSQIGLQGILELREVSECSITACAIRAAECSPYPMAIIVSKGQQVCYAFPSDNFKSLKLCNWLRKGSELPQSHTSIFNKDSSNILHGKQVIGQTSLTDWYGGDKETPLDEEIIGLGSYGYTLTVLSSEELPDDPDEFEEETEEDALMESWTPKFAYNR